MNLQKILDVLGSLKVTVACLVAGLLLVFFGTLAQVNQGIYDVQKQFFQSLIVYWGPPGADWHIPVLPGGYLVGGVFVLNLLISQVRSFELSWNKLGLQLLHAGLILLLLGQLATDMLQVETHMRLVENEPANYSTSSFRSELVFLAPGPNDTQTVISFPDEAVARHGELTSAALPFTVKVKEYFPNSNLTDRPAGSPGTPPATQGTGLSVNVAPKPLATRTDDQNIPSAVIELFDGQKSLGTWLVSSLLVDRQTIEVNGKAYQVAMQYKRFYKPYNLTLLKFTHEKYKGTEIPKNFASRVRVNNPATGESREVLIYMNNPLRYGGETYYQGSYDPNDKRVSILQVVRNPGWLTPYIACILVGLGMSIHFVISLIGFSRVRRTA